MCPAVAKTGRVGCQGVSRQSALFRWGTGLPWFTGPRESAVLQTEFRSVQPCCRAHPGTQQTSRQTTKRAASVATGYIYAMLTNNKARGFNVSEIKG